jgi:hypothetical protein
MTSRNPKCNRYNTIGSEALGGLDEEDCVALLLKAAEIPTESWLEYNLAAKEIVSELGSHTLALIQAGAYVTQGYCSLNQYPTVYRRQCERLLKFSPTQAQSRYCNVYATFEASAQILETSQGEDARDALDLFRVLSMLHYNHVPTQLFQDAWTGCRKAKKNNENEALAIEALSTWHVSQLPAFLQAELDEWDSFRLQKAQNILVSLALVNKGTRGGLFSLSMHPLIHHGLRNARIGNRRVDLGKLQDLSSHYPTMGIERGDHTTLTLDHTYSHFWT